MKSQKLKGNLLLLLTSIIWGISFIAQSKGVELITPMAFIGTRTMLGAIVLIPFILITDYNKKKSGAPVYKFNKTLIISGTICGLLLFFATWLQTEGLLYTSPGKSGFITALYMVMVPIVGLFTGKKTKPIIWIAVLVAIFGLYLMCLTSDLSVNKGDILTLYCAVIFTIHILVIDHYSPKVDGVKLSFLQFFICGALGLIYMFLFEEPDFGLITSCWLSIGYSGIFSCGVAYTLQIIGQKYTDPTSASLLMSLESVFATLSTVIFVALGWNLTGGQLTLREILGCVIMFAAIILVQLPEIKEAYFVKKC